MLSFYISYKEVELHILQYIELLRNVNNNIGERIKLLMYHIYTNYADIACMKLLSLLIKIYTAF